MYGYPDKQYMIDDIMKNQERAHDIIIPREKLEKYDECTLYEFYMAAKALVTK